MRGRPYLVPHYRCAVRCVLTNKTPTGTCRAPGRFEANFVRERLLDLAATRLGIDRAELRLKNFIRPEQMPYDTGLDLLGDPLVYDSGDYAETFCLALERAGYARWAERKRENSGAGPGRFGSSSRRLGIGFGAFVEKTGIGPPETARVTLNGGQVEVVTGAPSLGQGHETTLTQICAEALGVRLAQVHLLPTDTDRIATGGGTFGSRGAMVAGPAVHQAATQLRAQLLAAAAERWGVPVERLELRDGLVREPRSDRSLSLAELAAAAPEGQFVVEASFQPEHMAYAYGTQCVVVQVDTETGKVEVLTSVVAADLGRVLSPRLAEGQLQGAAAQGLGGALFEEFIHDPESAQPLATSFLDYLLPTASETPAVEAIALDHYPTPLTPLGAKGAGEAGIAAIANAVADALGPEGDAIRTLPITPLRVFEALHRGEQDE